ncbi:CGR1 [Lepeophtheirus salmonis]|uniref:Coiled-coil domain-containing protein 86 n=1 Tax=Lepeophtheirus salmonis TaxID=72036 RepID=A0A7R8H3C3_LEPSM|nr:CGR1 [Lepeophtheirus salmonis]CAF2827419.1 CGR1 [Lepeophtheirus salmonis]
MRTRSKGPAESIADKVLTRKRRSSSSSYESPSRKKNNISSDKTTEYGAKSTLTTLIENSTVKTKSPQKSPIKAKSPQKSPFKEVNEDQNEAPLHLSDMDEDTTSKEVEVIYEFEHKNHSQVPNNVPKSPVKFDSLETIQVEKAFAQIVPKSRSEKMVIVDRVKVRPIVVEGTKKICRSGRFWKSNRDRFFIFALERSIKDENKMKKEELKQRRLDNAKRREINERKSEVVQTLKNPAKIKRMKKKQLRMLAKRDLTRTEGVVAVA